MSLKKQKKHHIASCKLFRSQTADHLIISKPYILATHRFSKQFTELKIILLWFLNFVLHFTLSFSASLHRDLVRWEKKFLAELKGCTDDVIACNGAFEVSGSDEDTRDIFMVDVDSSRSLQGYIFTFIQCFFCTLTGHSEHFTSTNHSPVHSPEKADRHWGRVGWRVR